MVELVLQRAGAGGDDGLQPRQQRRHQVGEGLAGAGAGFGEQHAALLERIGDRGRQVLLRGAWREAGICMASTPPSARAARLRAARFPASPASISEAVDAGDRAWRDLRLRAWPRRRRRRVEQARLFDRGPVAAAQRADLRTQLEGVSRQRFRLRVVVAAAAPLRRVPAARRIVRHDRAAPGRAPWRHRRNAAAVSSALRGFAQVLDLADRAAAGSPSSLSPSPAVARIAATCCCGVAVVSAAGSAARVAPAWRRRPAPARGAKRAAARERHGTIDTTSALLLRLRRRRRLRLRRLLGWILRGLSSRPNQLRQPPPCLACCASSGSDSGSHTRRAGKAARNRPRTGTGARPGNRHRCCWTAATHCQSRPLPPTCNGALGRRENSPDHTRIAPVAPYRPVGSFWSLPTQTTARWSPV